MAEEWDVTIEEGKPKEKRGARIRLPPSVSRSVDLIPDLEVEEVTVRR